MRCWKRLHRSTSTDTALLHVHQRAVPRLVGTLPWLRPDPPRPCSKSQQSPLRTP
jgi:hypothetical protein